MDKKTKEVLKGYGLDSNPNLTVLGFDSDEDWLELRKAGIGGSDVGAIMGINKYNSALDVYKTKVLGEYKDVSDKPAVRKGKDLEPLIRSVYFKKYFDEKNFDVLELHHMLINSKYPWLRANLDGIAIPKDEKLRKHTNAVVCEIKVVTEYAEDNWFGDEYCGIPASYYAQVQEYMLVTETKYAVLGALFEKNWEMHFFKIPADPVFQDKLIKMSKIFYEVNMTLHIAPKLNAELDKDAIIKELEESDAEIKTVETQEITDAATAYIDINRRIKDLEAQKKQYLSDITNRYLAGERSNSPLVKIKIGVTKRTNIDTKALKEKYPDIAQEFTVETEYPNNYIR